TGVLDEWFPAKRSIKDPHSALTNKPDFIPDGSRGLKLFQPRDDREVLMAAKTAINGPKFVKLFKGDINDYGDDRSRAEQALVNILVYWCNGDIDQADRLFRMSR